MGTGHSGAGATCPGRARRAGAAGDAGVAGLLGLLSVRVLLRVLVCVLFTAIRARYPVRGGQTGLLVLGEPGHQRPQDRKSTRLNSSYMSISYAVFCLKKKKNTTQIIYRTMN